MKKCSICGNEYPDDALSCPYCDPRKRKLKKLFRIIILGVLILLLIGALGFHFFGGDGSPTISMAVHRYFDCIEDSNQTRFVNIILSDQMEKYISASNSGKYDDIWNEVKNTSKTRYRNIRITSHKDISSATLSDLLKKSKENYGIDLHISKMSSVNIEFQSKNKTDENWNTSKTTLIVYQTDGKWFIAPSSLILGE